MTAHAQGLGNLVGIVDRNKQLMTSYSEESMKMEPYADKWRAFGWNTIEVDGHDMNAIVDAIDSIPPVDSDKPTVLVCDTIKGKGVNFMEKVIGWHAGALSEEDYAKALDELKANYPEEAAVVGGAE